MKADSHSPHLEIKYGCDLLRSQFLHIVKNQDHPEWRGYAQDSLMQEMMFFAMDRSGLGTALRFDKKTPQFLVVRNQLVK